MNGKGAVNIVHKIALKAVDYLDSVLFARFPHIRKSLQNSVIGDRYCRMAPISGALYYLGRLGERVKGGKTRMYMKLDPLFLGIVGANMLLALHDMPRLDDHILVIAAVIDNAGDNDVVALVYL